MEMRRRLLDVVRRYQDLGGAYVTVDYHSASPELVAAAALLPDATARTAVSLREDEYDVVTVRGPGALPTLNVYGRHRDHRCPACAGKETP